VLGSLNWHFTIQTQSAVLVQRSHEHKNRFAIQIDWVKKATNSPNQIVISLGRRDSSNNFYSLHSCRWLSDEKEDKRRRVVIHKQLTMQTHTQNNKVSIPVILCRPRVWYVDYRCLLVKQCHRATLYSPC